VLHRIKEAVSKIGALRIVVSSGMDYVGFGIEKIGYGCVNAAQTLEDAAQCRDGFPTTVGLLWD
jgi:hypothetical protein